MKYPKDLQELYPNIIANLKLEKQFSKTPEQLVAEASLRLKEEGVPDEINAAIALIQLERYRNRLNYHELGKQLIQLQEMPRGAVSYFGPHKIDDTNEE